MEKSKLDQLIRTHFRNRKKFCEAFNEKGGKLSYPALIDQLSENENSRGISSGYASAYTFFFRVLELEKGTPQTENILLQIDKKLDALSEKIDSAIG